MEHRLIKSIGENYLGVVFKYPVDKMVYDDFPYYVAWNDGTTSDRVNSEMLSGCKIVRYKLTEKEILAWRLKYGV